MMKLKRTMGIETSKNQCDARNKESPKNNPAAIEGSNRREKTFTDRH
jgi:predicted kinase